MMAAFRGEGDGADDNNSRAHIVFVSGCRIAPEHVETCDMNVAFFGAKPYNHQLFDAAYELTLISMTCGQ
ncbi:hypothetical protein CMV30_03730 [Nibricoccus aquaticus]|uniref:Uncharacterized protein n=2 Tax=Nibricoccus aquaticus TaxID=2576891 RepID=A0A290QA72_9BACT|nr:hypothetical protein CMV30_03730 [Nibricoccus aquaticus]